MKCYTEDHNYHHFCGDHHYHYHHNHHVTSGHCQNILYQVFFFSFYFTLKLQFLITAASSHAGRTFATCMFAKILLKPHQKSTRVFL